MGRLSEVLKYEASLIVRLSVILGEGQKFALHHETANKAIPKEVISNIRTLLEWFEANDALKKYDLVVSDKILRELVRRVRDDQHPVTWGDYASAGKTLNTTIQTELETKWFYFIEPRNFDHLDRPENIPPDYKQGPPDNFNEAAICLMLDRYTACVFHLMRHMEAVLRHLCRSFKYTPKPDFKKNPNWTSILRSLGKEIDARERQLEELQRNKKKNASKFRDRLLYLKGCHGQLSSVKDVWRNPTMHVERDYNALEARQIYDACRVFFRSVFETKLGHRNHRK